MKIKLSFLIEYRNRVFGSIAPSISFGYPIPSKRPDSQPLDVMCDVEYDQSVSSRINFFHSTDFENQFRVFFLCLMLDFTDFSWKHLWIPKYNFVESVSHRGKKDSSWRSWTSGFCKLNSLISSWAIPLPPDCNNFGCVKWLVFLLLLFSEIELEIFILCRLFLMMVENFYCYQKPFASLFCLWYLFNIIQK